MWAQDHQGRYPESLDLLAAENPKGAYLKQVPECPKVGIPYKYRSFIPPADQLDGYEITCPDGRAHGLPADEPRYNFDQGLIAGVMESRFWSSLWHSGKDLVSFVSLALAAGLFLASLACRPTPTPMLQAFLDRSPALRWLSTFSWFLLVSGLAAAVFWAGARMLPWSLTLIMSVWLAGVVARSLVNLGHWGWAWLAPPDSRPTPIMPVAERPELSLAGQRDLLLPSLRERRLAAMISVGLPGLVAAALIVLPALESGESGGLRGSLFGLAVTALLSFPLYLWAKVWAKTFTQRELEWIPGSGQLLEHRLDGTRTRLLGTAAKVEQVRGDETGYTFVLGGETFRLPLGQLGRSLSEACAP